jgi:hypothetical protein
LIFNQNLSLLHINCPRYPFIQDCRIQIQWLCGSGPGVRIRNSDPDSGVWKLRINILLITFFKFYINKVCCGSGSWSAFYSNSMTLCGSRLSWNAGYGSWLKSIRIL